MAKKNKKAKMQELFEYAIDAIRKADYALEVLQRNGPDDMCPAEAKGPESISV
jgi:hypothetical protein